MSFRVVTTKLVRAYRGHTIEIKRRIVYSCGCDGTANKLIEETQTPLCHHNCPYRFVGNVLCIPLLALNVVVVVH